MRAEYCGHGMVVYEKDQTDLLQEAMLTMVRLEAQRLDDDTAAGMSILFEQWQPGTAYTAGERICDEAGALYRVEQAHTAQEDWPMDETPALYTKLGVTVENPGEIPQWTAPEGAHNAYQKGDQVLWQGKKYESQVDANVWAPDVTGWTELVE